MANHKVVILESNHVTKRFPASGGRVLVANNDVSLKFYKGETLGVVGESGCGKSTLLNIIAGKIKDYSGEIIFEREHEKGISYVFQEDTLIPWKTVYSNLEFVLKGKVEKSQIDERIKKYLKKQ